MPELMHEQTGLKITRNERNGFVVVSLHYTADPKKRSEEWRKEAQLGLSRAKFAQEYDLDYTAQMGEKAFPEFHTGRSNIIVTEPHPKFEEIGRAFWGGFDHGLQNPSSFHIYTIEDGVIYCIWELYERCRNIIEFSAKMKACPYYDRLRYIAVDPHVNDLRHYNKEGFGSSLIDQFMEQGIKKWFMGSNNEASWVAMVKKHWASVDNPTFRIFNTCPNMLREFEGATFVSMTDRQLLTANFKESLVDKDNHAMDDCKYFMLSIPKLQKSSFKSAKMDRRWLK